jgi:hypothetical protein
MSQVPNLTFESLSPTYKHGWYCITGHYMKLISEDGSISRDIPAHRWTCKCKSITINARDRCFENCRTTFQQIYILKTFSYDETNRSWMIDSAEFIGDNRINATRRIIHEKERTDILSTLKQVIEDELQIEFETWRDYFSE